MAARAAYWIVVLSAWCIGGCSVVTMDRLGGGYRPATSPRCSANALVPLADLVVGSVGAIGTGREVREQRAREPELRQWSDAGTSGALAAVILGSAIYGWIQIERCDNARDAHDRWLDHQGYRRRKVAALAGGGHAR